MTEPCTQEDTIKAMSRKVDGLHAAWHGNGDPGAKTRLILVEQAVSELKGLRTAVRRLLWGVVSAALVQMVLGGGWLALQGIKAALAAGGG